MKKILFIFMLALSSLCVNAQQTKSYVVINCYGSQSGVHLQGNIPDGMKSDYYGDDFGKTSGAKWFTFIANVLNLLGEEGYCLEQVTSFIDMNDKSSISYVCSKTTIPEPEPSAIQKVTDDSDGEAYEVARYNLQGMSVGKNEKGIQIIVYSNYTTKTVIVE